MRIKVHLSGYDITYNGEVLYFGYMPTSTEEEKIEAAEKKLAEMEAIGVEHFYTPRVEPLPTLSETDEAILNTNANVEYLVALKELEV